MNIEVYTDGSCYQEYSVGGWGVYISLSGKNIQFSGTCRCKNSASVEFLAVLKALEYIDYYFKDIEKVDFYTDCDYVVKVVKEFESRGKFSFKTKTSFKNKRNIAQLLDYVSFLPIEWHIVKSHRGNKGNQIADSLARKAAQLQIKKDRRR